MIIITIEPPKVCLFYSLAVDAFNIRDILNFHPFKKADQPNSILIKQQEKQSSPASAPIRDGLAFFGKDLTNEETGVICDACIWIVKEIEQCLDQNQATIVSTVSTQCVLLETQPFISVCQAIVNKFGNDLIDMVTDKITPEQVCKDIKLCCDDSSSSDEPSTTATTTSTTTLPSTTTTGDSTTTTTTTATGDSTTSTTTGGSTTISTGTTTNAPISSGSISTASGTGLPTSAGHTSATGGLVDHEGNEIYEW
ncbi:hypothetical protein DFA_00613 [Cavenderia fasciculata]|uniref:Saposin B-type domain-containing protein n=1 Tax=Cavenderia fasciculata TaxID=261658 RepID=F4PSW1_CACFS|nr:uncharacterized protein DFA_00613 [Cavenderia fasciculata]EGG20750.1 hypothetical protein DFA_00613 [Cavenderia fasciculata]|eukprot:XP_004358600.1 hypothetical protein DFA_00613 [Cavenderia fasciculata]